MIVRKKAYPRAALIGNPSDGYFGKTISFTFSNFSADVTLYETPELEIIPNTRDHSVFGSIDDLIQDVNKFGYYGGIRLLKASVKRFYEYCRLRGIQLHDRNFTLRYGSTIPHLVGLAGSSAIITACMKALMAFYGVSIPKSEHANLILSVEKEELGITAGLQDRVAQVYQGLVYMDFDRNLMEGRGYGDYMNLDTDLLPNVYIAYRAEMAEGSEVFHNNLAYRYQKKEPELLEAIDRWKSLTDQARECLVCHKPEKLGALMNEGFDIRASLCKISSGNLEMIKLARSCGCSSAFTGSGGAIAGVFKDKAMYDNLKQTMAEYKIETIIPEIVGPVQEE